MRSSLTLFALFLSCAVFAAEAPFALVPRVPQAPALDGKLADPVWAQAAVLPTFALLDASGAPTQQTEARLCHDGTRLYLGVICRENNFAKLQATSPPRDAPIWGDDEIEVFIGGAHYYHLMFNAAGAISDEECRGEAKNMAWNADLKVAAGRRSDAWTATLSVPLAQVGLALGSETGFNLCRNEIAERELSCWSPTLSGFHQPSRFGRIALGAGPAAVTALAWSSLWPGRCTATLAAVGADAVQPTLALVSGAKTIPLPLQPAANGAFSFDLSGLGTLALQLDASAGGKLLSRQYAHLAVTDYRARLAALDACLAAMPAKARDLQSARAAAAEVDALARRVTRPQDYDATSWLKLADEIGALNRRVDSVRLRATAIAKAGDVRYALGVQSPLVKMLKDDPFSGEVEAPVRLSAARHEYEAAQLVVFAFDEPLQRVALEFSDLKSPDGKLSFAKTNLSWRHVGYIRTEKPSYAVPFVGLWPDPLIPTDGFDVPANSFESAWITAYVPRGTAPGDYSGTVTVKPANASSRSVPFRLHIYGFTLPRSNHIRTSFGCGIGSDLVADKWWGNMLDHRVSPTGMVGAEWKPARFDLSACRQIVFSARLVEGDLGSSLRFALVGDKTGQRLFGPIALRPEWQEFTVALGDGNSSVSSLGFVLAGPAQATIELRDLRAVGDKAGLPIAPLPTHWFTALGTEATSSAPGVLRLQFSAALPPGAKWLTDWPSASASAWEAGNVRPEMDFTRFDRTMSEYLPRGLTACVVNVPSAGYQQSAALALKELRQSGTAAIARAWEDHLREKGWLPLAYTYMADEPETQFFPALNTILAEAHRGAPGLHNLMTARGAGAPGLHNVDIWCPEVYSFNPDGARAEQAKGRQVWWYVAFSTRHPFPDYWIDYPALDCRVLWWMAWKHKLDGMLYWSINYRYPDAWKTAMLFPGANGDGSLVYPAKDGGVVDSIRWEAIRDGAEDYEYLWLLRECVKMAETRGLNDASLLARAHRLLAIDDNVVRSFKDYNPDPAKLLATRDGMATVIEALCRKLGTQPKDIPLPGTSAVPPLSPGDRRSRRERGPGGEDAVPAGKGAGGVGAVPLPPLAAATGALYRFETNQPFANDDSGAGNHGVVTGGDIAPGKTGRGLRLSGEGSSIVMPAGASVLGSQCTQGTIALWVRPDYDPLESSEDTWSGWTVFLYAQHTSSNGLPDGYNEIGLAQHGKTLFAKISTAKDMGGFPAIPVPLRKGQWTHLAFTWSPTARILYVDGKPAARVEGAFAPVDLDGCPVMVGKHPPTGRWNFAGTVDDVLVNPRAFTPAEIAKLAGLGG